MAKTLLGKPWPEDSDPTAPQFANWFRNLSEEEATVVASRIMRRMSADTDCFMQDHLGTIDELRRQLMDVELAPDDATIQTPEQWRTWYLSASEDDQLTAARHVIGNSHTAHTCRSDAHARKIRELTEFVTDLKDLMRQREYTQ